MLIGFANEVRCRKLYIYNVEHTQRYGLIAGQIRVTQSTATAGKFRVSTEPIPADNSDYNLPWMGDFGYSSTNDIQICKKKQNVYNVNNVHLFMFLFNTPHTNSNMRGFGRYKFTNMSMLSQSFNLWALPIVCETGSVLHQIINTNWKRPSSSFVLQIYICCEKERTICEL